MKKKKEMKIARAPDRIAASATIWSSGFDLTKLIIQMDLGSQLPRKIVDLLFTITDLKLLSWRFCGGVDFVKPFNEYTVRDKLQGHLAEVRRAWSQEEDNIRQCPANFRQ